MLYQGHAFRFPRAENIERGLSHCLSARAECHSLDLQNPKKSIVLSKLGKKTAKGGKIILASPLEQKQARYKGGDAISW